MKKITKILLTIVASMAIIIAILFGLWTIYGKNIKIKHQLKKTYHLDVDKVEVSKEACTYLVESVNKMVNKYKYGATNIDEDKEYYKFIGWKNGESVVYGYADQSGNIAISNHGINFYWNDLMNELRAYVEIVLPSNEYTIYTERVDGYLTKYCETYEDYRSEIVNCSQYFDTYVLVSESVTDDELAKITQAITNNHYPIVVSFIKIDNNYYDLFKGRYVSLYETPAIEEIEQIEGFRWEELTSQKFDCPVRKAEITYASSDYWYNRPTFAFTNDFYNIKFVIDNGSKDEIQLFHGLDSLDGSMCGSSNDYIFFKDGNMRDTLEKYIGHKLSILQDGELVFTTTLTEEMIFEDYALRVKHGEIEKLNRWFTWKA